MLYERWRNCDCGTNTDADKLLDSTVTESLSVAASTVESTAIQETEPEESIAVSEGFSVTSLGVPTKASYNDYWMNPRNPWDMISEDGKHTIYRHNLEVYG